jgi:hypothetical protein
MENIEFSALCVQFYCVYTWLDNIYLGLCSTTRKFYANAGFEKVFHNLLSSIKIFSMLSFLFVLQGHDLNFDLDFLFLKNIDFFSCSKRYLRNDIQKKVKQTFLFFQILCAFSW